MTNGYPYPVMADARFETLGPTGGTAVGRCTARSPVTETARQRPVAGSGTEHSKLSQFCLTKLVTAPGACSGCSGAGLATGRASPDALLALLEFRLIAAARFSTCYGRVARATQRRNRSCARSSCGSQQEKISGNSRCAA